MDILVDKEFLLLIGIIIFVCIVIWITKKEEKKCQNQKLLVNAKDAIKKKKLSILDMICLSVKNVCINIQKSYGILQKLFTKVKK